MAEAMGAGMPAAREAIERWLELLARWSDKTDLTGARTPDARAEVMVADAFVIAEMVAEGAVVLDVGAGAGGPGIPLALLREDLRLTLVEPRARRVAFLRTSIGSLGLVERVRVVAETIDPARPVLPREAFAPVDVAFARATFAPEVWLPLGLALAPRTIVLSTHRVTPSTSSGARLEQERTYRWPWSDAPRWAGVFARVEDVPEDDVERAT